MSNVTQRQPSQIQMYKDSRHPSTVTDTLYCNSSITCAFMMCCRSEQVDVDSARWFPFARPRGERVKENVRPSDPTSRILKEQNRI